MRFIVLVGFFILSFASFVQAESYEAKVEFMNNGQLSPPAAGPATPNMCSAMYAQIVIGPSRPGVRQLNPEELFDTVKEILAGGSTAKTYVLSIFGRLDQTLIASGDLENHCQVNATCELFRTVITENLSTRSFFVWALEFAGKKGLEDLLAWKDEFTLLGLEGLRFSLEEVTDGYLNSDDAFLYGRPVQLKYRADWNTLHDAFIDQNSDVLSGTRMISALNGKAAIFDVGQVGDQTARVAAADLLKASVLSRSSALPAYAFDLSKIEGYRTGTNQLRRLIANKRGLLGDLSIHFNLDDSVKFYDLEPEDYPEEVKAVIAFMAESGYSQDIVYQQTLYFRLGGKAQDTDVVGVMAELSLMPVVSSIGAVPTSGGE